MMNDSRQQEETLFDAARKLSDPIQRKAFLDTACAENPQLRRRLEVLLSAEPAADRFFEEGGAALNAPLGPTESLAEDVAKGGTVRVTLPPEEQPGARISLYKLREKVGEGGCGVVYVAEQEEPVRRRVALKVIKPGMDTRQVVARFEAERQALAMMDHPNIAKVLDAGTTENGRPYFVMELVRGIRITDYCDQNHLATNQRLELFIQVCNAVQHAHQKGIIHRDLKPSNILVTLHDGVPVPKVIDFGIAKATEGRLSDLTVYTALHQFIGTPAYMSPEQAEMSGLDIDTRSDIYSLGVLLYELLTGDTPFDAKELLKHGLDEIRRTIREVEPPKPSTRLTQQLVAADGRRLKSSGMGDPATEEEIRASSRRLLQMKEIIPLLRGDLDWIVMKCLEKDRTRRYETANGLALDLKRFLHHEPVVARPPSTLYRLQKLAKRNKVAFAAGAIVLSALVSGLGISTWALLREQKARREADLRRQEAESARTEERQQRSRAEEAARRAEAGELAARQFAYASDMNLVQQALAANNLGRARELLERNRPRADQSDLRGWEWRYLWQRCQSDALYTFCRQPESVMMIAVLEDQGTLLVRNAQSATELWHLDSHKKIASWGGAGCGRALTVSPSSDLIAFGNANASGQLVVEVRTLASNAPVTQIENVGCAVSLGFAPDGKTLAIFSDSRGVQLWDADTQKSVLFFSGSARGGMHKGVVLFSPDGRSLAIGGSDGQIRLFDLATRTEKFRFAASSEGITALAFSSDGTFLASGSGFSQKEIRLWNLFTGEHAGDLTGHNSWITSLIFARESKILVSASGDQTIRFWDTAKRQQIGILRGHQNEVYTLAYSKDGKRLFSGSKDGEVCVWDPSSKHSEKAYSLAPTLVSQLSVLPDNRTIVSVNRDRSVSLWDAGGMKESERIPSLGTNNWGVVVSADGRLMAVGDYAGRLKIWDLAGRREVTNFSAHVGTVVPMRFLTRSNVLVSGDSTGVVKRWDVGSWRETGSWKMDRNITAVTISPEERILVAGHSNGTIKMWDAIDGGELTTFQGHYRWVTDVAFTPDGKLMVTSSEDGLVKLWDPTTHREVAVLKGHLLGVHSFGISPDGQRLATGSNAKEAIKIWDLATRQELLNLEGQGAQFDPTKLSPDGNLLVSVNSGGELHYWRAPSLVEIEAIETANAKSN